MGLTESDIEHGGSRCPNIGTYLLGGSEIGPAVWVRDMDPDAAHEESIGWIPPQGDPQADGETNAEGAVQRMGLPPTEG